jgi:nitroreductase/dihydropteridine reductase
LHHLSKSLPRRPAIRLLHWIEKQTYLTLGLTLMAAAELRINATPQGFNSRTLDTEFGLREKGFTTKVLLALGDRDDCYFFAKAPKSRLPMKRHFTFL